MNKLLIILVTLLIVLPAKAETFDMSNFSKLPIQHDGRIKPLESFARHLSMRLNNTKTVDGISATRFLAEAFFNPADVTMMPVFQIRNKVVKDMIGISGENTRFSLSEVVPALQAKRQLLQSILEKDNQSWSREEQLLVKLYEDASFIKSVITSLHIVLPLKIDMPENARSTLDIPLEDTKNYLSFQRHEERFQSYLKTLPETEATEELKAFLFQLAVIEKNTDPQNLIRIMPPEWPLNQTEEWQSPWLAIQQGLSGPESAEYLKLWQQMAEAYRTKNYQAWSDTTKAAFDKVSGFPKANLSPDKLALEVSYLSLNPYFYSLVFYCLATLLAGCILSRPSLPLIVPTYMTLLTGTLFHALALTMRIIILERPPVSTLYESVIFVSLICCAMALLIALFSKERSLFILLGALCGIILYFVGGMFASSGDTLQVLTAVLDTSFWLATHVVIITAGYGTCLLTAILAHYYLFAKNLSWQPNPAIYKITFRLALLSLLLTSVGTILGGIWADQSWGRFWGWDPKENGALLIVLWLVWIIHGKIAGQLKETGFMIGAACLSIIVALAWFGVNLLNVGLHSYGFISGIAYGLLTFCIIECVLIAWPGFLLYKKSRNET